MMTGGESEDGAVNDFSDDSDFTYYGDEIDDVVGDNDSHVTAQGNN
jgi:hypothetical protein